jgi:hypothetical protein
MAYLLEEHGITLGSFHPSGLITAAATFQIKHSLTIREIAGTEWLLSSDDTGAITTVLSQANRIVSSRGVATLSDLIAEVGAQTGERVDEVALRQTIETAPGIRWLDQQREWFFLPTARNVLATFLRKILSVSARIHVSELRTGLTRHYRLGVAPSRDVLLRLCAALGYQVEGESVESFPPIDPAEALSETEYIFYDVFRNHGPLLSRRQLEQECLKRQMNRHTFWVYLSYSPILERFAAGVYGLRGAQFSPGQAEGLVERRSIRSRQVLKEFGWTQEGAAWFAYKISEAMIENGVCSMPAGMRQALGDGEWPLYSSDGVRMGTLVSRNASMWGLGPLFRRRGAEAGDILVIEITPASNKATAHLGSDEILDVFSPPP